MAYPYDIYQLNENQEVEGKVGWRCPSNIAIVKYWGKHGQQLPNNASLSFTLSNAHTDTYISYKSHSKNAVSISFLFEGIENPAFASKIEKYLENISAHMPIVKQLHFDIESTNSFPHSSGIASSASSMAAISMCLSNIESDLFSLPQDTKFIEKASYLARLGSGSASRSLIGGVSVWGEHSEIAASSNLHAIKINDTHEVFNTYHDDILIVSAHEKPVSSTAGHALMNNNVYANPRYEQANKRVIELLSILKSGDVHAFGKLAEDEAMTLHALMMCSDPSYVLMEPGTLDMIREIRAYRAASGVPVFFTLDAGPNIHLLYPDDVKSEVEIFINNSLMQYTAKGVIIKDKIGNGPQKLV